jgi:hypothetical protein
MTNVEPQRDVVWPEPGAPDVVSSPPTRRGILTRQWVRIAGAAVVAFAIGAGVGGASASKANDKANAAHVAATKARQDLAAAAQQIAVAKGEAANATQVAQNAAEAAVADELSTGRAVNTTERARLAAVGAALAQRKTQLDTRERQIAGAEAAAQANSFGGDGLYLVGSDVKPGTYKAAAAPGCYYARLRSTDTSDVIDNNNIDGPVALTIRPSDFAVEVARCATFYRVR